MVCLKQPIYAHWFGLELLNAYESARLQIEKNQYPVQIQLDNSTYEIEWDSLRNATTAIRSASTQFKDNTSHGGRGFMGCPELRNNEAFFSSLFSRALDRFVFPDEATGACLHQAPCRLKKDIPEKSDTYFVQFHRGFVPGDPVVLSDVKKNNFHHADRESSLYSGVGVEEGDCLDLFPVLIGIPATPNKMELQLHVNIVDLFWKLLVVSQHPWDEAILCTLKAGVHHLIKNNLFQTHIPCEDPMPFKEMSLYSILGRRKRVFLKKDTDTTTVIKFFDTVEDDFFHPSVLEELIRKIPAILPMVKLKPYDNTGKRVYMLCYIYIQGNDGSVRDIYQLKEFVGVVKQLSEMHKYGFVHGDIRLANMVFPIDGESCLIDFDFVGMHNRNVYANSYNYDLNERCSVAVPKSRMLMEHDRFSLEYIIRTHVRPRSRKRRKILSMLKDLSCSLEHIVSIMD